MKYFFSIISLFTFTAGLTAMEKSPELTAPQFYYEKAAAISITQPVLRTMKLLSLLEKCPSRADELHELLKNHLKQTGFPPQIKSIAQQIMEKNPGNLTINLLLYPAYGETETLTKKWQKMLLICPTKDLSSNQERAVLISSYIVFKHFADRSECNKNREFFLKFFDRFDTEKCHPRFRMLLLEVALDFYRQCIWETDCISPNGKFWKKLPDEGNKMLYLEALQKLENLEKAVEHPISLKLLQLYNSHNHPRAVQYAGNFLASKDRNIIDALFFAAQTFDDRKLFDHCVNYFTTGKDSSKYAPIMPVVARFYASKFKNYELLKKYTSKEELEFFQNFYNSKFAAARTGAEKLLTSGNITYPAIIRTMVELVWQTRDKALLKIILAAMEKNSELLNAENANSVAYTAAVLNIELEQAEKLSRLAVKQLPDNYAVMDTLAYTLYRRKNFSEAHKIITAAEKLLSPGDACAVLYLHAAEIELAHTKDKTAAKKWLDRGALATRDNDDEFDYSRAAQLQEILKK